jgi:hemerythrin-like domain-containing protein
MVGQAKAAGRLERQPAKDAVAFFRDFADRCHHGKEEAHLFPAIEAKGFPRQGGPTGVMLDEHEQGRAHVRGMAEAIDDAASGDAAALRQFIEHAEGYISLLREHIYKEDHVLFQLADRTLSEADQEALSAAFGKVEAEEMGLGTHERCLRVAEELAKRYGVAGSTAFTPGGHFHCGHGQEG